MKFKVGDRVKLKEDSMYYNDYGQIPVNTIATITKCKYDEVLPIEVEWFYEGEYDFNTYDFKDLILVVRNNKLNKILFPDYEVSEDGKYLYI